VADAVNSSVIGFLKRVKKYSTINYVLFEPLRIRYVCGGGNGLLVHNGQLITFSKQDAFLGLRERPYRESILPFEQDDLLALYTDGIVEAQDQEQRDYSIRRLSRLIQTHAGRDVQELLDICVADYREFCSGPQDDVTLLIMRKK
jgi:sigma-B regulation protein RsbU (phosphoserine phosphatase)